MRELLVSFAGFVAALLMGGAFTLAQLPYLGFAMRGERVALVDRGSLAEAGGLKAGDRIVKAYSEAAPGSSTPAAEIPIERLRSLPRGSAVALIVERDSTTASAFFIISDPPRSEAVRRLLFFLTAVTFLLVGLFTFVRRPDPLGRTFLLCCLSFALILRAPLPGGTPVLGTLEEIITDLAGVLLGASLLHFVFLFPRGDPPGRGGRRALLLAYGFGALLLLAGIVFSFGSWLPPGVKPAVAALAALYVAACLVAALILFVRNMRRTRDPSESLRLRVVQWGTLLSLVPFLLAFVLRNLTPGAGLPGDQFAVLTVWLLPLSTMYAIVRHQIFDIRLIIRRGLIYFLVTTCMALVYFGVVLLLGPALDPAEGHPTVAFLSLVVIALIFTGTRNAVQSLVDRTFFRKDSGIRRKLAELSGRVATLVDSRKLETSLLEELFERLEASRGALYVVEESGRRLVLKASRNGKDAPDRFAAGDIDRFPGRDGGPPLTLPFPPALKALVDPIPHPVTRPELLREASPEIKEALRGRLDELGFDLFVPLRDGNRLHAVVAISLPPRGSHPSSVELDLLSRISHDASQALSQALRREDEMERERISGELAVARSIQQHLLPEEPPLSPLVDLSGITVPCEAVGGDCHDYVKLPDGRVGFAVADVSGKGVPAAILMASLQASFRAGAEAGHGPAALLRTLNRRVLEIAEPEKFVCFFYALIDPMTMEMRFANAGLEPPLLIRHRGRSEELAAGGPVLGVLPGADYDEGSVTLSSSDVVVIFSDGLVDARKREEIPLDRKSIVRIVRRNHGLGAESLRRLLLRESRIGPGSRVQDDVTVVVARIY